MLVQSQILATLRSPGSGDRPGAIVRRCLDAGRIGIARHICDAFGFRAARGQRQRSGCLTAPGVLERRGFRHPARRCGSLRPGAWGFRFPRRFRPWTGFHRFGWGRRSDAGCGTLCHILNMPMAPRRSPDAGSGLWRIPAVAFRTLGLSAPGLCARGGYIGSRAVERLSRLRQAVCPSRFLIRPAVRCQYLASHVPGLALRRLPAEVDARDGHRPLLEETLVQPEQEGTGFKASRFTRVGYTAGPSPRVPGTAARGSGRADSWLG